MSPSSPNVVEFAPSSADEWQRFYDGREALAADDPVQSFFFDLDRQVHGDLMALAQDIPPAIKEKREKLWAALFPQLHVRLEFRFRGLAIPEVQTLDALQEFSSVVKDAAAPLLDGGPQQSPDWTPASDALRAFATGELRQLINVGSDDNPVTCISTEPDSYFLFFFAEFAFAALEANVETEMWAALLPSLVLMQELYTARFDQPRNIMLYGFAEKMLPATTKKKIEAQLAALITFDVKGLEKTSGKILRAAGRAFWP